MQMKCNEIFWERSITLVNCTSQLLICVLYNSASEYYFDYYIMKLYLPPPGGEESPWTTASHWRQKQIFFQIFRLLSYIVG